MILKTQEEKKFCKWQGHRNLFERTVETQAVRYDQ